ncbi:ABC transporter ATP-binding protein [Amycolatopsis rubida]|uniref:ABC transporter ATP-binding protein n=1 Tax=Amycolatopsis rubida TaxID=112413 RepID=A0ABX0BR17_9PSEU|nr:MULTISPECIES: ABC transporter ATP-binding protein [Amycolatopsis]MYW90339.1 ATP-binding cassette domain-containing protein [Amycolatopsis rubida]NEC55316.1 ABC transporter ATP-binding protein [Amycolatopsis rubida]OAP20752.1 putative siderophore transport system ATP-binding protein YusV [Amycolatopsis sp. M39]
MSQPWPEAPALAGTGLALGYGAKPVVQDAGIVLRAGAVTVLVGPNGSGKSTLLRSLARLHPLTAGEVRLAGQDALALSPKEFARHVTLLTQSRPTPGGVRVRDVVSYGRHPYRGRFGSGDPEGPELVERAMRHTGVDGMAERPVDELSGGELQRVWLATCFAQDTGVVLLDEPTTFLDLRYQIETLDLVRDLADEHGVAVGVVLHDLDQAAAVADEVVLLCRGSVRATGRPADVLTAEALSDVYGLRIDVHVDDEGHVRTRPVGRHTSRPRPVRSA